MASNRRSRSSDRRPAGWLVALLLAAALGSGPALAGGLAGLAAGVDRLQREAAALRPIHPVQAGDSSRLARFEVRLGQLEEELRRLTGRIEQLEHGQRELNGRFDQLISDLDHRLTDLEATASAADAAVTRPAAATAAATDRPPAPELPSLKPTTEVATARAVPTPDAQDQTLGRIPESALATLPTRPDPSTVTPPRSAAGLPPQAQYDAAMELLRAGDYAGAAGGLELFLELNPDHPLAANAAYWQAETHYVRKDYAGAAASFARSYRTYGKTAAKAPDSLLKLGMSLQGLGQNDNACRSYDELAKEFPGAPAHILQALTRERARAGCA